MKVTTTTYPGSKFPQPQDPPPSRSRRQALPGILACKPGSFTHGSRRRRTWHRPTYTHAPQHTTIYHPIHLQDVELQRLNRFLILSLIISPPAARTAARLSPHLTLPPASHILLLDLRALHSAALL